jgi:4-diphosphocytidyl-2-C-methyl-D-erythritol kinase
MVVFPPAKINLGLHVLRKRKDGYHDIDTCFYPVSLTDVLEAVPSESFQYRQTGMPIPGDVQENLCVRAYQLLRQKYQIDPVEIHLHKIIPMGAGLGGGSSDGAHMLKILDTVFDLNLGSSRLKEYSAKLGSDCPFFIDSIPALGSGTGTDLAKTDLSLKGTHIQIIHPGVHVSTAQAYGSLEPRTDRQPVDEILRKPISQWKGVLINDFCQYIYDQYPVLADIEDELYANGAVYASMTGSGSAVYGLFESEPPAFSSTAYFTWTGELS